MPGLQDVPSCSAVTVSIDDENGGAGAVVEGTASARRVVVVDGTAVVTVVVGAVVVVVEVEVGDVRVVEVVARVVDVSRDDRTSSAAPPGSRTAR